MQMRFRPLAASAVGARGFHAALPWPLRGGTERPCRNVVVFSSAGKEGEEAGPETPEEARRRLAELDKLLEGLTEPKMRPPAPPPPPDPYLDREVMKRGGLATDEMPEFSPTYVAFSTFALVILTIFTNVMFELYIKPSVDGVEQPVRVQRTPMVNPADRQSE
ncbi:hypothetical protein PR202_gb21304 [Eleusine coracana subsp. coracana]|uniref:Uncharacterized protein n=1 Tax=Eleusine coracana subsp. coracana TaxID=191504 RepID=A0AAV5FET2_ELECO|nr:hypothetical protein QOZ80_7BG0604550 [Eleusine coracana subsp. coracana]GJN32776.1 hypothetical protein PR202_gb21304 [Eleusine coracana subsp. coracana]